MEGKSVTRRDFLKTTIFGIIGTLFFFKLGIPVSASVQDNSNLNGEILRQTAAPVDQTKLWLNTSSSTVSGVPSGALAYWNASVSAWKPTTSVWG